MHTLPEHILYSDVKKIQCIVYVQGNIIEKNTMNKSTIKIMYLHTYSIALIITRTCGLQSKTVALCQKTFILNLLITCTCS